MSEQITKKLIAAELRACFSNLEDPKYGMTPSLKKIADHIDALTVENERLRQRLLTSAGDDLCRLTQEEIKDLTDGKTPIPPKAEFLASCERFHAQIAGENGVNQNCLTLAQLVAENERLTRELHDYKTAATEEAAAHDESRKQLVAARAEIKEAIRLIAQGRHAKAIETLQPPLYGPEAASESHPLTAAEFAELGEVLDAEASAEKADPPASEARRFTCPQCGCKTRADEHFARANDEPLLCGNPDCRCRSTWAEVEMAKGEQSECKTPELIFTAGPLRNACQAGWHAARGEASLVYPCALAARDEAAESAKQDRAEQAEAAAGAYYDVLERLLDDFSGESISSARAVLESCDAGRPAANELRALRVFAGAVRDALCSVETIDKVERALVKYDQAVASQGKSGEGGLVMSPREEVFNELIADCEARIRGCECVLERERKKLKVLQAKRHKARVIKAMDKQPPEAER